MYRDVQHCGGDTMDKQRLKSILKQSEGPKLDFKELLDLTGESGKKELAKDVLAITNSQGGRGHIIIGIRDHSKEVVGIDPLDYKEERIQQVLSLRCDPPVNVRAELMEYEKKWVCIITVFRSYNKPHQMLQTGAFYVRRGSTTDVARRDEIASMMQYNGLLRNEQIPIQNMTLSALDWDLLASYMERSHLEGEESNYGFLCDLGFLHYDIDSDSYFPTIGGVMLFCKNPQMYLPYLGIKIINDLNEERETLLVEGNAVDMLNGCETYLESLPYKYPKKAVMEAIFNSILHRDYFDSSRSILVYLGHEQVYISNPGSVYGEDRLNTLLREDNPSRRNNWLYHKIMVMDASKKYAKTGTGLSFIKNSFVNGGKVKFLNIRKLNLFKVVLPGFKHME